LAIYIGFLRPEEPNSSRTEKRRSNLGDVLWYGDPVAVKGPGVPSTPPVLTGKSGASTPAKGNDSRTRVKADAKHSESRKSALRDEKAETSAAFERHHTAELEEERRRHASGDREGDQVRETDEEKNHDLIEDVMQQEGRRGRHHRRDQPDDEDDTQDAEEAAKAAVAARAQGFSGFDARSRLFESTPEDRMGDLALNDPNEMKRLLGPSVRFAQHAMLLAEDRFSRGLPRDEAVAYMADLFVGVQDRNYANKALREFGHATGIIDIYPLEVIDHLLTHVPSFFTKCTRAPFVDRSENQQVLGKVGEPIPLCFDEKLRVRGFALPGGQRPGYLLEPGEKPGSYTLVFQSPGEFRLLLSAIRKDGWVLVDDLLCKIEPSDQPTEDPASLTKEREASRLSEEDCAPSVHSLESLTIDLPKKV
jgi:hypothetical protein